MGVRKVTGWHNNNVLKADQIRPGVLCWERVKLKVNRSQEGCEAEGIIENTCPSCLWSNSTNQTRLSAYPTHMLTSLPEL